MISLSANNFCNSVKLKKKYENVGKESIEVW